MHPMPSPERVAKAALSFAKAGKENPAMHALALADALRLRAEGDRQGKRLALVEARALRRAMQQRRMTR